MSSTTGKHERTDEVAVDEIISRKYRLAGSLTLRGIVIVGAIILGVAAAATFGIEHGSCPANASIWTRFVLSGFVLGFIYAMIALGYSMVYGILQLLNFAHSEVFMVGSFAGLYALSFVVDFGGWDSSASFAGPMISVAIALVLAALMAGITAVLIERIAYRPLRRRGVSRLGYLITAIGVSIFLQNIFLLVDGQRHLGLPFNWPNIGGRNAIPYPDVLPLSHLFSIFGVPVTNHQILVFGTAIAMLVFLDMIVRRTYAGQQIRAVAEDAEAASLLGVNINRVIIYTFFIGGAMAGIAGALYGIYYGHSQFNMGFIPGIKAFTAAVLGGIGNIRGAMLGGLLLGLIENLGVACVGVQWQGVISFSVLVLVLTFRPTGILGEQVRQ